MNHSTAIERLFDSTSRIGNDVCDLTNRNKVNIASANYMLENYASANPITEAFKIAFKNPNIILNGSPNGGFSSDHVDENNVLTFGQGTNLREKELIQQRIFSTIPFLGKGEVNVPLENTLRGGIYNYYSKSTDSMSEVTNFDLTYIPLIPALKTELTNPANFIENSANDGWIRGGVPSRLLAREEVN
jgi:hypothetical protein